MESTFHVHLAGKEKASKYLSVFNYEQNKKNPHFKSARKTAAVNGIEMLV